METQLRNLAQIGEFVQICLIRLGHLGSQLTLTRPSPVGLGLSELRLVFHYSFLNDYSPP